MADFEKAECVAEVSIQVGAGLRVCTKARRDNCQCRCCVHEETKQRLLDTFSV
jgi:hypothetical protein